jgi:hypothetical protein
MLRRTIGRCEVSIFGEDGTVYARSYITMFITETTFRPPSTGRAFK